MEVAPVLAAMGETASRDDLIRRVAERLDLEPAMVMGRVVAARPLNSAKTGPAEPRKNGAPGAVGAPQSRAYIQGAPRARAPGNVHCATSGGK